MNEELIKTIKELEIKTAPEEQSLEAANQNYTKKQLTHFIERHDLPIAKSWLKDEIVTALSDWMADSQKELLANNQELQTFYQNEVLQADELLNSYNADLSDSDLEKITQLIEYGLVYNVGGELWAPETTDNTVSSDVESSASPSTSEEGTTEEKGEAVTNQTQSPKGQTKTSATAKKTFKSSSTTLSTEEKLAQNKQARLKYLREQAKKKKRKKKK